MTIIIMEMKLAI